MSFLTQNILIHELSSDPIPVQLVEIGDDAKHKKAKTSDNAQSKKVMVCVTKQKNCERLIRQGAKIAEQLGIELMVVHAICPNEHVLGSEDDCEALEFLFRLANEHGAEMHILRAENALDGLADAARKHNVELMVLGASPQHAQSLSEQIKKRLPGMNFIVLGNSAWAEQIA